MRFNFGGCAVLVILILIGLSIDSPAEAGILKNGVRPGDRTKMNIVRVPRSGARKRILRHGEKRAAPTQRQRRGQQHAWFWKIHSATAAASSKRWEAGLKTMNDRRGAGKVIVGTERINVIVAAYGGQIAAAARKNNVSEALLTAVIAVESGGQPGAVSPKGAQGLMQLIPATAKRFGVTDSFSVAQNINGGAAYLNWLLREFNGDIFLTLAGYNAGEGAVRKHKGVPPFRETRDYVVKVLDGIAASHSLCTARPTGPRDRCAWGRVGT